MQRLLTAVLLFLTLGAAAAQDTAEQFLASLHFQQGKIALPGGIATLDLPPAFRYLAPADTARLLEQGWGNPPGATTLGMVLPSGVSPLSDEGWGVVVTYEKDGHVKDDDADSIDYGKLLKEIQDGMAEENKERKEQGYPAMTVVGWAEKPHYDKAQHKLYWAKELRTEGAQANGLNYNIRVLGREGVLVLNAVAGLDQLAQIRSEMRQVTAFSNFNQGHRYADFNASTDKVAEYGIAALVAGGVAAKLGFFGKLLALLVAFKKLIILAVAGLASFLWKFMRREKPAAVDLGKAPEA
ncbi:DUF2167 domain-containing protein [Massilia sp. UMI-21]|nr:DUF2167 domain-containing protein [Massilia sp. UMI-21]